MVGLAASEGAGEAIRSIACVFAERVLQCAPGEVGDALAHLFDVFLVARGYFVDLACAMVSNTKISRTVGTYL
jgi:hypothetical protein